MAKEIIMPQISLNETSYILSKWYVKVGDTIKVGDPVFCVEGDKATEDIDSEVEGTVLKLLYTEYDEVPATAVVCYVGTPGEAIPEGEAKPEAKKEEPKQETTEVPSGVSTIIMPQISLNEKSYILAKWYVKEGDEVKPGDHIFSVEGDKATEDIDSEVTGTVLKLLYNDYDEVPATAPVCYVGPKGTDVSGLGTPSVKKEAPVAAPEAKKEQTLQEETDPKYKNAKVIDIRPQKKAAATTAPTVAPVASLVKNAPTGENGRVFASPRAKALAKQKGIDIALVCPCSFGKRITEIDVMNYKPMNNVSMPSAYVDAKMTTETIQLSKMRQAIAKNMMRSLSSSAQLTVHRSIDASKMMAKHKADKSISYNGMIVKAISIALNDFRYLNANVGNDNSVTLFGEKNIGFACDTDRGLIVPVIKNVEDKTEQQISSEMKELADKCRDGKLSGSDTKGATFTITTLGSQGIEYFTPIINYPQTGILGVGAITQKVRKSECGIEIYPAITVSLTFDHCIIDGAPAALFVKKLAEILEN